jgi:hypothetical protein
MALAQGIELIAAKQGPVREEPLELVLGPFVYLGMARQCAPLASSLVQAATSSRIVVTARSNA